MNKSVMGVRKLNQQPFTRWIIGDKKYWPEGICKNWTSKDFK
jgi:hypothetical protein